tara:strand:- start:7316 stop:8287 length:972 start_codon:yes stop_codon:yes gene_type:complete
MQILITGVAGFIGFNISRFLLLNKNIKVYGIDNINDYYSISLKLDRIQQLKKFKNFKFKKIDITNKIKLENFFKNKNFSLIINLAAQAGVRYSLKNPSEFVKNNILGFYNLIYIANKKRIKKIIYASSSSVYGDSKNYPLKETTNIQPKNIYSLSKKNNEEMAEVFSSQFGIKFIGLRFFTVYGEWGRPDMFMMKYLTSSYNSSKKFYLNNYGNHTRDFTYINDVCEIMKRLIFSKKKTLNHEIYNICSNNPIKLISVINSINSFTGKKPKTFKRGLQKADVVKTHGSNKKILTFVGQQKFTPIEKGLKNTIQWYKKYYNFNA